MKYIAFIFFIIISLITGGQTIEYTSPVKIPVFLSGSFAELRANHFHSGIDIKTQGVTGVPVYSVADGYISRIVVSPTGFGLALYINHSNGTTSVYGHLESFRDDIAKYVKNIQYERKSFRVDLQVSKDRFPVKQDEFIARSGNSGSSGGPHLHFEIRDTQTEEPLNPLHYSLPVKDNTPPRIYSLMITSLNEYGHVDFQAEKKTFPVVFTDGKYQIQNNPIIPVYGMVGYAIQSSDFFDGSNNRCGVYSIRLFWDGELWYSFTMDRFSFPEGRYVNSHTDYEEFITTKRRFHKTWIDPGNRLRIYDYVRNNGQLRVTDGNIHMVRFELKDLHGNTSILDFRVESKAGQVERTKIPFNQLLKYEQANRFREENIRIDFPEKTFYDNVEFTWKQKAASEKFLSNIHVVHRNTIPLHSSARLSLKTKKLEKRLQEKALLVTVDTLTQKISAAGGSFDSGWVTGDIRSFGNYAVALDTVPPRIVPLSIRDKSALTESSRIRFRISDDLSGIKEYVGTLNGKWALFEYDAKTDMITHYFDAERFELGKRHEFVLKVTDNKGNESIYEASFWK
ncbi:MAG: M23 family metallopeptidase [Mariniphaga sp.]|nr:M23 family metallopeptidase [Mariniphaga sp.]